MTKQPRELGLIGLRLRLDPRFYAICMVRDPRDTIVSKHALRPGEYWHNASIARFKLSWSLIQRYSKNPRFMWIKYEDLIARPDQVQDEIAARLPFLKRTGRFSNFHVQGEISARSARALNGVRAIDSGNQRKWMAHLGRLRDELAKEGPIDEELFELGYEDDPDWARELAVHQYPAPSAVRLKQTRAEREKRRYIWTAIQAGLFARLGIPLG